MTKFNLTITTVHGDAIVKVTADNERAVQEIGEPLQHVNGDILAISVGKENGS